MDFTLSAAASVVAAAVLAVVAMVWRRLLLWRALGHTRDLWAPFLAKPTTVIITGRAGGLARSTRKVSFCEHTAVCTLCAFFRGVAKSISIQQSLDCSPDAYRAGNVILVGSQKANDITKDVVGKLPVLIQYDENGNLCVSGKTYPSVPDTGETLTVDHALILKVDNPFCPGAKVLVLAGNHGAATETAVEYVTSPDGIATIARARGLGSRDFVAILKVDFTIKNAGRRQLVGAWSFSELKVT